MEYNKDIEIRGLLEAWLEGETTCEQESRLREYFLGGDVPADLLYAKAMFAGFAAISATTTTVAVATVKPSGRGRMLRLYKAVSIAASFALAVGLAWTLAYESKPKTVYCYVNGVPVTDMNIAARQAQMVARLIDGSSKATDEGIAKVAEASKPIETLGNTLRMLGISPENVES